MPYMWECNHRSSIMLAMCLQKMVHNSLRLINHAVVVAFPPTRCFTGSADDDNAVTLPQ